MPEDLDRCCDVPDARVHGRATDEVAGTGRPASRQTPHRFEASREPLPRVGSLQATGLLRGRSRVGT